MAIIVIVVDVVDVTVLVASVDVVSDAISGSVTVLLVGDVISSWLWYCIFEWPFLLFEQPPLNLCHNHSNFDNCLSKTDWCLCSFTLSMKFSHSWKQKVLIWLWRSSIHVSFCHEHVSMVLLMLLTHSFASCFSALSIIHLPLVVLMLLFNFKLFEVIF